MYINPSGNNHCDLDKYHQYAGSKSHIQEKYMTLVFSNDENNHTKSHLLH